MTDVFRLNERGELDRDSILAAASQARVPKGSSKGGQFARKGGGGAPSSTAIAKDAGTFSPSRRTGGSTSVSKSRRPEGGRNVTNSKGERVNEREAVKSVLSGKANSVSYSRHDGVGITLQRQDSNVDGTNLPKGRTFVVKSSPAGLKPVEKDPMTGRIREGTAGYGMDRTNTVGGTRVAGFIAKQGNAWTAEKPSDGWRGSYENMFDAIDALAGNG